MPAPRFLRLAGYTRRLRLGPQQLRSPIAEPDAGPGAEVVSPRHPWGPGELSVWWERNLTSLLYQTWLWGEGEVVGHRPLAVLGTKPRAWGKGDILEKVWEGYRRPPGFTSCLYLFG